MPYISPSVRGARRDCVQEPSNRSVIGSTGLDIQRYICGALFGAASRGIDLAQLFHLCHPDLVFALNEGPLRVLLRVAQLCQEALEIVRVGPLKLEVGDEIVIRGFHSVVRMAELSVNAIHILGPDGGVGRPRGGLSVNLELCPSG
jgi:hypothetical protein